MVVASGSRDKTGFFTQGVKLKANMVDMARSVRKLGQEDPRRVFHSLKVGLTLILVSAFYYYDQLYNKFGPNTIWIVMTVVLVFEFSVGATLGRGFNRGIATLLAGGLAIGAHHLTKNLGRVGEPVDLHNLIALNIEKLGNSLEGFGDEYFKRKVGEACKDDKEILEGYKSVLNSKKCEESLANFAAWEPGHGRFPYRHPWKLYLKVGTLARECAYRIEALNGYLNADMQESSEVSNVIQEACTIMSVESGKALKELALAIKTMVQPSSADSHIDKAKSSAENLKSLLKSGIWEDIDLLKVIAGVTILKCPHVVIIVSESTPAVFFTK
ncbi:hypothetical protein OIU85_001048 [Salix viminalis]|uniref:Aluminum-activated malate transporter n=1 Tax=Salix viminalis TaxID=40686 RepID=A0A9Q0VL48_SALVM|nr:hypothetical protein OIU85_001048 [Salix viminalis]